MKVLTVVSTTIFSVILGIFVWGTLFDPPISCPSKMADIGVVIFLTLLWLFALWGCYRSYNGTQKSRFLFIILPWILGWLALIVEGSFCF